MKVFTFIFLFALIASFVQAKVTDVDKQLFRGLAQQCKTESGAVDVDIEGIISLSSASSKQAKCLRACLLKQVGLMNSNGKFVKDIFLKLVEIRTKGDSRKITISGEVADICKNTPVSSDHCEAAEQYGVCFLTEYKKRNISVLDF